MIVVLYLTPTNHIEGHQALADQIRGVVEDALSEFSDRITSVDAWGRAEGMALYRTHPTEMARRTTEGLSSQ